MSIIEVENPATGEIIEIDVGDKTPSQEKINQLLRNVSQQFKQKALPKTASAPTPTPALDMGPKIAPTPAPAPADVAATEDITPEEFIKRFREMAKSPQEQGFMRNLISIIAPQAYKELEEKHGGLLDVNKINPVKDAPQIYAEAILQTSPRVLSGLVRGGLKMVETAEELSEPGKPAPLGKVLGAGARVLEEEVKTPGAGVLREQREALEKRDLPGWIKFLGDIGLTTIEDPATFAATPALKTAKKAVDLPKNIAETVTDWLTKKRIKPLPEDLKAGFRPAVIREEKLFGSMNQILKGTIDKIENLSEELNKTLSKTDEKIDINQILLKTLTKLTMDKEKVLSRSPLQQNVEKEIIRLYKTIDAHKTKGIIDGSGALSALDATILKRGWGQEAAFVHGFKETPYRAREVVANEFYTQLKEAIEKMDIGPEAKKINERLSKLIPVEHALYRRIPSEERKQIINRFDVLATARSGTKVLPYISPVMNLFFYGAQQSTLLGTITLDEMSKQLAKEVIQASKIKKFRPLATATSRKAFPEEEPEKTREEIVEEAMKALPKSRLSFEPPRQTVGVEPLP